MKRLLLVLLFVVGVSTAYAAELKLSGDAMVRGNYNSTKTDESGAARYSSGYFDYDFNIFGDIVLNENATIKTKLTYDKDVKGSGKVADSASDSNLTVERMYINYKFHPALQLNTGLMGGGQWATTFGDTEINVMRVQAVGALSEDLVFLFTYEKQDDQGGKYSSVHKADRDDTTVYYLCGVLKFAPITVKPLFTYAQKGISGRTIDAAYDYDALWTTTYWDTFTGSNAAVAYATADGTVTATQAALSAIKEHKITTKAFNLGLDGDFGVIGFTSEFAYKKIDTDGFKDESTTAASVAAKKGIADSKTYGAYVDIFAKIDPAKVGFAFAYGSSDEKDGSYNWGADFDFTTVVDDLYWGADQGMAGMTAYKLYAEAKADKLTVFVAGIYGAATDKKVAKITTLNTTDQTKNVTGKDLSFMEVDASIAYAFDANSTYTVGGGYAAMTDGDGTKDVVTGAYNVYHKFALKF